MICCSPARNVIMKKFSFLILIQSSLWLNVISTSTNSAQTRAVEHLIERLIGEEKSASFQIKVVDHNNSDNDWFSLEKKNNSIHIVGSSGVAAAYGFQYYLRNFCQCHISWDHDQLNLPDSWPEVKIFVKSIDRYRYYQNVCVSSYSYVWWTWPRWEREIDWMALNGFNLALAFTGQEAIWRRVYQSVNMTETEINGHFAGPAFLAWNRMGNIRGWGGPLPESWHEESMKLQRKIVKRMKELGINPILPAFCGFIPVPFKRLFPHVKMTTLLPWVNFPSNYCCPYLLDPTESLFQTIGEMFMREMKNEFGLSHFYNCDTFNENIPQSTDPKYLQNVNSAIFRVMNESDANATWILQGWLFASQQQFWTPERVKHFLDVVPNDRMIVLDLHSELNPQYLRLDSYFGKPFIWCMLHNFGGTLGMHGSLGILNSQIVKARKMTGSTLIGTGLTPEGINQNYIVYDFMTEVSWRNESVNLDNWVEKYSVRRYGKSNINSKEVWRLLKNSVYNYSLSVALHGQYTLCVRPKLNLKPWIWYNSSDVALAWDLMLNITDNPILGNLNFKHDIVDLTRQVFQLKFDDLFEKLIDAFYNQNNDVFISVSLQMLDLLIDLDSVLSTNTRFMLGSWIREAKARGKTLNDRKHLVANAKNQITLWGPNSQSSVLDYATKQWSGVVSDYYYPRWKLFCQQLYASLVNKVPFHQHIFDEMVFSLIEKPFVHSYKMYPSNPLNDTMKVIRLLYDKWRAKL